MHCTMRWNPDVMTVRSGTLQESMKKQEQFRKIAVFEAVLILLAVGENSMSEEII